MSIKSCGTINPILVRETSDPLCPKKVDDACFPLNAGVNFSYLNRESHFMVSQYLEEVDNKVSVGQAVKIQIADEGTPLKMKRLVKILKEEVAVADKSYRVSKAILKKYFVGYEKLRLRKLLLVLCYIWVCWSYKLIVTGATNLIKNLSSELF